MMAQDGTCLISRSSRKENYGFVMEKTRQLFSRKAVRGGTDSGHDASFVSRIHGVRGIRGHRHGGL